jgi:hypothetical protein
MDQQRYENCIQNRTLATPKPYRMDRFYFRHQHIWLLEPVEGGTKVTTAESFEGFVCWLMPKMFTKFLDETLEKDLNELKKAAEI